MFQFDPVPPLRDHVIAAIRQLRTEICWKPGKGLKHVRTRQKYGHLPSEATLADYEAIITRILFQPTADVHIYVWQQDAVYPTVVALYENEYWLVMFSLDGIMETAFPPTDPLTYLSDPRFRYIGTIQELLP